MIITKEYAKRLIKNNKAEITGKLNPDSKGNVYVIVTRFDQQRVDHYVERFK